MCYLLHIVTWFLSYLSEILKQITDKMNYYYSYNFVCIIVVTNVYKHIVSQKYSRKFNYLIYEVLFIHQAISEICFLINKNSLSICMHIDKMKFDTFSLE